MQETQKKKGGFTSVFGFVMAAAGSAVGLGNLWGFPYKTAENGGAAFVFVRAFAWLDNNDLRNFYRSSRASKPRVCI